MWCLAQPSLRVVRFFSEVVVEQLTQNLHLGIARTVVRCLAPVLLQCIQEKRLEQSAQGSIVGAATLPSQLFSSGLHQRRFQLQPLLELEELPRCQVLSSFQAFQSRDQSLSMGFAWRYPL